MPNNAPCTAPDSTNAEMKLSLKIYNCKPFIVDIKESNAVDRLVEVNNFLNAVTFSGLILLVRFI